MSPIAPLTSLLHAAAGLDRKAGEIVLKVVNSEERPMTASIDLRNVSVEPNGKAIVPAGNPKEEAFPDVKPSSFTILRVRTR